jgi:hypothetical protein
MVPAAARLDARNSSVVGGADEESFDEHAVNNARRSMAIRVGLMGSGLYTKPQSARTRSTEYANVS